MPYADNLYSADESDVESFSEELSPTDGYFSTRNHPQDVMVLDPSLQEGTAESKAQEARRESEANQADQFTGSGVLQPVSTLAPFPVATTTNSTYTATLPTSNPSNSPSSASRRSEIYTEASSLLHSAPPPTYSDATSQQPSSPSGSFNSNYRTISNHDLEEGLASRREPESMGNPVDPDDRQPVWMTQVKKIQTRTFIKNILLILLVLVIGIGFLVTGINSGQSHKKIGDIVPTDPQTPIDPEGPRAPGTPEGNDRRLVSYCPTATDNLSKGLPVYTFDQKKPFSIIQADYDSGSSAGPYSRTAGKIIFRRLRTDASSSDTGLVTFNIWGHGTHGPGPEISIGDGGQLVIIKTPRHTSLGGEKHCLSVEATVWLPENSTFESLQCSTSQLSIEVFDDINIRVPGRVSFEAMSGNIILPAFQESDLVPDLTVLQSGYNADHSIYSTAPVTRQHGICGDDVHMQAASGSIKGTLYLYDTIELRSYSGSIDVVVLPQKSKDGGVSVASLDAKTMSGTLRVRYPTDDNYTIPARDYRTLISTESGSIHGTFYVGSTLAAESKSGSINIDALPGILSGGTSDFTTNTFSGSTHISLLSPPRRQSAVTTRSDTPTYGKIGDGDPYLIYSTPSDEANIDSQSGGKVRQLTSSHAGTSGSVKLLYPEEWEGEIHATSISGNLRVDGNGVRTIKDGRKNGAFKEVIARKGPDAENASNLVVKVVSGTADIWVGDGCKSVSWCK